LGHVAIDGTKIKANARKRRSIPYARLCEREKHWQEQVDKLLQQAEQTDQAEAQQPAPEPLPPTLAYAKTPLESIRAAKQALEQEAQQKLAEAAAEFTPGSRKVGRPSKSDAPVSERERIRHRRSKRAYHRAAEQAAQPHGSFNFTDPDSRLMLDGATNVFVQAYNAQAAVDDTAQIIVACEVAQEPVDKHQLEPMVEQVEANTGAQPETITADCGYWDAETIDRLQEQGRRLFVPPDRDPDAPRTKSSPQSGIAHAMRERLKSEAGKKAYDKRRGTVEPVFGYTKQQRGFRQFRLRGYEKVQGEWALICLTHNLLRLFRPPASKASRPAPNPGGSAPETSSRAPQPGGTAPQPGGSRSQTRLFASNQNRSGLFRLPLARRCSKQRSSRSHRAKAAVPAGRSV
jgi:IS5 family transposase